MDRKESGNAYELGCRLVKGPRLTVLPDTAGIVTYIRNDIHGEVKANSVAQPTDILEATVWFQDRKYTILNIYNPPANNYNPAHLNDTEYHQTILAGSDHLPILTILHQPCSRKSERKTHWNFKKPNWSRFKETTDNLITAIKPTGDDPNLLCSQITEGILKAAADCIPRGCRKSTSLSGTKILSKP
ncbi:hypothetical protein ElyMa_001992900 [Elysia marginata]|uniref:Endonuclease/exonuclease/phosphatase domain-containing protein n=1 Tax=Elysia marginata TaxID=1093978 RepID=A0AAV4F1K4_9GAST|nr:hypothetical protein ElyMa_001992900 [Elysia marginata]